MNKDDKIALVGDNEIAKTTLFKILAGEMEPDSGIVINGVLQHLKPISLKITQTFFEGSRYELS